MNKIKWVDRSLEYRQGYFWGAVVITSFMLGINIGISILPMQGWMTVIPAVLAIIIYGIILTKLIPYLYYRFVLLNWKDYNNKSKDLK